MPGSIEIGTGKDRRAVHCARSPKSGTFRRSRVLRCRIGQKQQIDSKRKDALIETTRTPQGETVFIFHESLDYEHVSALWTEFSDFLKKERPRSIVLDFHDAPVIDSAGVSLLRFLQRHCGERGIPIRYQSVPPSSEYFLRYVETNPTPETAGPRISLKTIVEGIGMLGIASAQELRDLIRFIGDFILSTGGCLRHAKGFRWKETLYYAQRSGAEAMPMVFILSFLIGLVMSFQAAVQLRQFGANIYVADLVSLALTRELGPVFTAIVLAGRSGSAFAAEIGTMKVSEEVDALVVMGFDITRFLVLPKVFALAVCGPLLTL
ncbi:MAG: ABC transporter permease, partial [Syntrophobacteraceae bacterium]